jgi:hypothetical protein
MNKKVIVKNANDIPPRIVGVYLLINKKTNVVEYVGQSTNVYQRLLGNWYYQPEKRWYERKLLQRFKPRLNQFIPKKKHNYLHNPYL